MTQAFSLYTELTVRQNLVLHARLFTCRTSEAKRASRSCSDDFGLEPVADTLAESLPLGIRQRLSLAVAVLHEPEVLILDEPTSGVDPVARDGFWELLIRLSREQGVTIFLSTHFMNEAERCDRMSMMHRGQGAGAGPAGGAGRGAQGAKPGRGVHRLSRGCAPRRQAASRPQASTKRGGSSRAEAARENHGKPAPSPASSASARVWAFARREAIELRHDTVRLAFAVLGPLLLMIVFGYGISLDVEHLTFAVLDFDRPRPAAPMPTAIAARSTTTRTSPSRTTPSSTAGCATASCASRSRYRRASRQDLTRGRQPTVAAYFDAAMPFRAETARSYVESTAQPIRKRSCARRKGIPPAAQPVNSSRARSTTSRSRASTPWCPATSCCC